MPTPIASESPMGGKLSPPDQIVVTASEAVHQRTVHTQAWVGPPHGRPDSFVFARFLNVFLVAIFSLTLVLGAGSLVAKRKEIRNEIKGLVEHGGAPVESLSSVLAQKSPGKVTLTSARALLKYWLFGTSGHPSIRLGRQGWMFWFDSVTEEILQRKKHFSPAELDRWCSSLIERQRWLEARGIDYVFVIAPDATTVYGEFAPDGFGKTSNSSRVQQLVKYVRERSTVKIVDLSETLIAHKPDGQLYYKTDSHWNDLGAYYGYREILRWLNKSIAVSPLGLVDFHRDEYQYKLGGLAKANHMSGMVPDLVPQLQYQGGAKFQLAKDTVATSLPQLGVTSGEHLRDIVTTEISGKTGPNALVMHDSFCLAMQPMLSSTFSRVKYLWQSHFDTAQVQRENPRVVIQEVAERFLEFVPEKSGFDQVVEGEAFSLATGKEKLRYANCWDAQGTIKSVSSDPYILLPAIAPRNSSTLLRANVTLKEEGTFQVFWKKEGQTEFEPANSVNIMVPAGTSQIQLLLPKQIAEVRVDPCGYAGDLKLNDLKLLRCKSRDE